MEQTLILLKPDCLQRRLVGRILSRFEDKGLNLVAMKLMRVTPALAQQHYAAHVGKPFYAALDLQSKEENDWCPNLTVQTGMFLGTPDSPLHRARVFLEFFNGRSNMGQYYNVRERYFLLGLGYDF